MPISWRTVANIFIETLFYVPKGIVFPIARELDSLQETIYHPNLPCHFCSRSQSSGLDRKRYIYPRVENIFQKITNSILNFLCGRNSQLQEISRGSNWLQTHRDKIVWLLFIPGMLLTGSVVCWGIEILPEIYLIYSIGFYWSEKLFNPLANLIVHRQHSSQWNFLKDLWDFSHKKEVPPLFYHQCHKIFLVLKWFLVELVFMYSIGRVSKFLSYCLQDFPAWLIFYCGAKMAFERSPEKLCLFESEMKTQLSSKRKSLSNITWLVYYHQFKVHSSNKAQLEYVTRHQKAHYLPCSVQIHSTQPASVTLR